MELSRSNPVQWRKSSRSVTGECVEVASNGHAVLVRDSQDRHGSMLTLSAPAWQSFVLAMKQEEMDGGH
jgi:Domain of unknown function (DUF397)